MTKIVQQVGGSAPEQDAYTGESRQLTVDTDNWNLRLHDDSTPGGRIICNIDFGDQRWQAKSAELDGFTFNPEAKGFLTRTAAGQFRLRSLAVNPAQLTIERPDGYTGNPFIALADRIETAHTFGLDLIIEGVLQVDGGVNSDTSGTHYGPVEGSVQGNVTGDLTGNASGSHTGSFTGDVDVSGDSILFAAGQIPLSALNGLLAYVQSNSMPLGVILLWSGSVATIPAGFALCDGLNGTPNLTDKFVIGAGSLTYDPGDAGGTTTHSHANTLDSAGTHTHPLTIATHALDLTEMPSHKHGNGVTDSGFNLFNHGTLAAAPATPSSIDDNGATGSIEGYTTDTGGGAAHGHAGSTAADAGSHTHTLNNVAASVLPPYYALCYIMRVAI
jgi:hypothetical protein